MRISSNLVFNYGSVSRFEVFKHKMLSTYLQLSVYDPLGCIIYNAHTAGAACERYEQGYERGHKGD